MTSDEDKKRWKNESDQLKTDLKNRKKSIQYRKIDIKFPKNNSKQSIHPNKNNYSDNNSDEIIRKTLGI